MRTRFSHWSAGIAAAVLLMALTGCNWLTPLAAISEQKQEVLAEFDKLPGSRTLVLIWTPPETLFDYPYARLELATYIGDRLQEGLTTKKSKIDLVDPRDVEEYLGRQLARRIDPATVGRQFDADYVVYLELLQFQIRDPEEPQFLRGRIQASVTVHVVRAEPDQVKRYELAPVETVYPKKGPVVLSATNSLRVREAMYREFAEQVARKFFDHTVDL
ncbi:MAG TPA: hypothetical protein PKK06_00045 [Phycisphaerae bacterium]|nr:hypothetical protein [Phycisphaerae bacterium]HNU43999.1 hypothetical protein [Phycisphaerae bacterium]